jgi:hypothetical protein
LGKGKTTTKYFQINHPTNVSIESHIGNNTKEPTTNARIIWIIKIGTNFVDDGAIIGKNDMLPKISQ